MSAAKLAALIADQYACYAMLDDLLQAAKRIAGSGMPGAHAASKNLHLARTLIASALETIDGPLNDLAGANDPAEAITREADPELAEAEFHEAFASRD